MGDPLATAKFPFSFLLPPGEQSAKRDSVRLKIALFVATTVAYRQIPDNEEETPGKGAWKIQTGAMIFTG